jgi:hypothetical protein
VDIRGGSPTLDRHIALVLKRAELEASSERGLAWDDPTVAINWPFGPLEVVLTDKDRAYSRPADVSNFFPMRTFRTGMRGDGSSRAAIGHLIHEGEEIRSFPCVQSKILGTTNAVAGRISLRAHACPG